MAGNSESNLKSYQSTLLWLVGIIFIAGIVYGKLNAVSNRADIAIERIIAHNARIHTVETGLIGLEYQINSQRDWQKEFMTTFKELVTEIKVTNSQVIRNTYEIEQVKGKADGTK